MSELSTLVKLKEQYEDFKNHPVWQEFVRTTQGQILASRRAYEALEGRTIDQLVAHEATRGGIASLSSVLTYPDRMLEAIENQIAALKHMDQTEESDDE